MSWRTLVDELHGSARRVEFDPGLTHAEVARAEQRFEFRFPPDLRMFLQAALPRAAHFPDWRVGDVARLRDWFDLPRQDILFDVEHNDYWHTGWGIRPCMLDVALDVASEAIKAAPRLIPVCSHRMMPEEPHEAGNPVFSVHQTDIIYYGFDLADYLRHEFNLPGRAPWPETIRPIRFWSDFVD
jgi:hypothetical protein